MPNRGVNLWLVKKSTDWPTRQKIQYEAMKGLMMKDFHGLNDYEQQIGTLMKAGTFGQKIAWPILKPLVKLQPRLRVSTILHPRLGVVGRFFLRLIGFDQVFRVPAEILSRKSSFQKYF